MATVTSKNLAAYNLAELEKRGLVQPKSPNTSDLRKAIAAAIQRHLSLPDDQRVQNSQAAAKAVAVHMGVQQNGQPKPLLNKNMKLEKAQRGYELDGNNTIKLPDGRGVEVSGLALAPAYEEGSFNTCPNSPSCKKSCLGKTSGNYHKLGGGADLEAMLGPRLSSYNRTQALLRDPGAFGVRLHDEIEAQKRQAAMNGNKLGIRLNVLSDLAPSTFRSIIEAHPDVQFYDYTKNNTKMLQDAQGNPINHHLTYSSTGVSQPAIGVENQHQNWQAMRGRLDKGQNVAMAFSHKTELPTHVFDEETQRHYPVLDGDQHDFRPIDGADADGKGFVVGLRNKAASTGQKVAAEKSGGFFVHFDPEYERDGKVLARDRSNPNPRLNKAGKPMYPPIVTNRMVTIAPQKVQMTHMDNDSRVIPIHQEV